MPELLTWSSSAPGPAATWRRSGRPSSGMKVACVEKRPSSGRHLPQRRLHPQQGDARLERAVPPGPGALRKHGIKVDDVELDLAAMLARKDKVVKGLTDGVRYLFRKNKIETDLRRRPG